MTNNAKISNYTHLIQIHENYTEITPFKLIDDN